MRTVQDRIRHAVLFEAIALAVFIPAAAYLFNIPAKHMGVVGVAGATLATVWNFVFNLGFDHAMQRAAGHTRKTLPLRVLHVALFEAGLLIMLLPPIAWYLGISLTQAFLMDMTFAGFYVVYAFLFNLTYDRVFPIPVKPAACAA
ncbi:PACE efflux transporter [Caulobacter mirabilis]|uniref:Chlorhexidine efflux transporter domain-containing protein n=1 Tax=Caulobacter mirabilis TaxID=69666 RepID=A0A2D2AXJ7_9CAUL|nr:PACE efflux transporter [Caulobacter mirabilis]ATQ42701.1 hypothetical protein CSW64_09900 [Caulobacter mirabilis]